MSANITENTLPIYDRLLYKVITYYATYGKIVVLIKYIMIG